MKTAAKVIFTMILIVFALPGQTQITFEKLISGSAENWGYDVVQTRDSGYVICGSHGQYYYQWPAWGLSLTKTDKYGTVQWANSYWQDIDNHGYSVQETSEGEVIAGGYTQFCGYHSFLVKTNIQGDTIFTKTHKYLGWDTWTFSVKQCPDQGIVLCGRVLTNDSLFTWVMKTDADGDSLWGKVYHSGYNESGKALLCLPDTGFVILSTTSKPSTILRKLDHEGETVWEKRYDYLSGKDFCRTSDNSYLICGDDIASSQIGVLKVNQEGDSLWHKTFAYSATPSSIALTNDGGYMIGGTIYDEPSPGIKQLFLLRLDQNGELLWTRKFCGSSRDNGGSVRTTFDQGYIFTGTTKKPGTDSIVIFLIKGIDDTTCVKYPESSLKEPFLIHPNPSSGRINITIGDANSDVNVEIVNPFGKCIYHNLFHDVNNTISLQVPGNHNGIHFLRIRIKDSYQIRKILLLSSE